MNKKNLKISVCMPYYNGSEYLESALRSVINQDADFYEIIIGDNTSIDDLDEVNRTKNIIKSFNDERIKYFQNEADLGYPRNLRKVVSKTRGDILFLMAHDDLLAEGTFRSVIDAFSSDDDVGVVTRPYFWFMRDLSRPVRAVLPLDSKSDEKVSIEDDEYKVLKVLESVGQLSGLAFRKDFLETGFHDAVFPAHIYPFLCVFTRHKCVFLKDFTVAVRIESSQTRSISSIYSDSPTLSWIKMFNDVMGSESLAKIKKYCIRHYAKNFLGLVQIRNYGTLNNFFNEIFVMIKVYPLNIFDVRFWFFVLGCLAVPRRLLIKMVDLYKCNILSKKLKGIKFCLQQ